VLLTRREVIKKIGLAGSLILAKPSPLLARWWAMQGSAGVSAGGSVAYAIWDEVSELSYSDLSDTLLFIVDGGLGNDETAVCDLLAGADLTVSNIAPSDLAATSGGFRFFDGNDDVLQYTAVALETILSGQTIWSIVMKMKVVSGSADGHMLYFYENGQCHLGFYFNQATDKIIFQAQDVDNVFEQQTTINGIGDAIESYLFMGTNGTTTRAGFIQAGTGSGANGQPTKWSDFTANDTVTFAALFDNIGSIDTSRLLGSNGVNYKNFYLKYMLISRQCVVDFDT